MELMELLKLRRTYRRFKQEPVSDEIIDEMLTAARYASSAANLQPLSYVVVKSQEKERGRTAESRGRTGLIHRNYRK